MAETAVKKRVSRKQKEKAKPKSVFLEALAQSRLERVRSMVLMREVEELRAENEDIREKLDRRLQQSRDSYAKQREEDLEGYKAKKAKYMREYRERKKAQG